MANITVDIQAKIVGYEQSIKTLQAALAKVDPGSDIGKKLGTALEQAKKQFTDLSKNMFPKASSDSQVDAIAEKVNRLGMSIQTVAGMFQSLNLDNLNLAALGPEITNIINQINTLQSTMDSSMNSGIREAVSNSTELSAIFKELGVDVSTMTAEGGMKSLSEGLDAARAAAAEAAQALSEIESKTQAAKAAMDSMKGSSPFLADDFHIEDVLAQFNSLTPEKVFQSGNLEKIQSAMLERLSNTKMSDEARAAGENLIRSMISGVDSNTSLDEFKQKIAELKKNLAQEIGSENKASTIVTTGTGEKLFESLFGVNEGDLDAARTKLLALVEQFRGSFSTKEYNNVTTNLVNERSIAQAASRACNIISDAFDKINKKYKEEQENFNNLSQQQSEAKILSEQANAKVETYDRGVTDYSTRITNLESQLGEARQQIAQLREQLEVQKSSAYNNMQKDAASASANAGKNVFPTAEADKYKEKLTEIHSAEQFVGKLQGVVQRWFSVYAAVRMVTNAIKNVISTTKELDQTITEIAIVTNMSQDQLWGQMDKYTSMAKEYGASISGVYKVSQLYYQQGLGQNDVMALSAETLKMARISGLDYATATDYMTNAVRSFKLEMTDAQSVVDTYSAVAATSATSVTELATAMSKTASSAQAVGSSLQNTTAMMAVMIEATRESPENIGSAMKSIISRYGELKENKTGIDAEGEEYSLNKVDTALQSVGISIHDAKGEFRDFDDVIMELADSWDKIDKNTQRYIATVMAGNRQQSRFLALVSSGERLKELSETAADSEDAGQMQFLKTLDSIEYKSQQMKTSLQSLYADEGIQDLIKDTLDAITNIIDSFSRMSDAFNTPIAAIAKFGVQFANIAKIVTTTFGLIKSGVATQIDAIRTNGIAKAQQAADQEKQIRQNLADEEMIIEQRKIEYRNQLAINGGDSQAALAYINKNVPFLENSTGQDLTFGQKIRNSFKKGGRGTALAGLGLSLLGSYFSTSAMNMTENTQDERDAKASQTFWGSLLTGAGMGSMFGMPGIIAGAGIGLISGIIQGDKIREEDPEERAKRLQKELETAQNENIAKKNEFKSLKSTIDEYEQLKQHQEDSTEAAQAYIDKCNEIAESSPDLVAGYDAEGNAIINLKNAYEELKAAKEGVSDSEKAEADAAINQAENAVKEANEKYAQANKERVSKLSGSGLEGKEYFDLLFNGLQDLTSVGVMETLRASLENDTAGLSIIDQLPEIVNERDSEKLFNLVNDNKEWFKKNKTIFNESGYSGWVDLEEYIDTVTSQPAQEELEETGEKNKTESQAKSKYRIGSKSVVDSEIQELLLEDEINNTRTNQYLSEFKNASTVMTRFIADKAQQFKQLNPDKSYFTGEDEEFSENFEAINKEIEQFWHTHFTTDKEKLNDLISNQGQYTQKDAAQILKDLDLDEDSLIYQSIMSYYQDVLTNTGDVIDIALDSIGKRDKKGIITKILTEDVKTLDEYKIEAIRDNPKIKTPEAVDAAALAARTKDESEHFLSALGESEKQSVISFYNNLLDMVDSKAISEASGEQVMDTYVKTWEALTDTENKLFKGTRGKETQQKLQTLLSNSDLSSEEGIQTFLSELDKLGITLEDLGLDKSDFDIHFPPNFAAKLQTYANEVATKIEDFEKDLKQATSGMDFSKASAMADKLGIKINKFRQEGNKFYLDDYNLLEEYYYAEHEERTAKLKEEQDKELKLLENYDYEVMPKNGPRSIYSTIYGVYKTQEDQLADLEAIFSDQDYLDRIADKGLDPAVFKRELIDFVKNGKEGQTFEDYMKENFKEQYDAYIEASDEVREYSMNSALLQSGQIDQFVKSVRGEDKSTDYQEYYDKAIASGAGQTVAENIARYQVEAAEKWNADSAKLAEQISSGDINNLDPELQEYAKIIYDTFHSVQSQTVNSILTAAKGGENAIFVSDTNRGTLEKMVAAGYLEAKDEDWVTGSNGEKQLKKDAKLEANLKKFEESGQDDWDTFVRGLDASYEEKIKWMEEYNNIINPNTLEGMAGKSSISISEFASILKANKGESAALNYKEYLGEYGLAINAITGQLEVIDEAWFTWQEEKLAELKTTLGEDSAQYRELKAEIETQRRNFNTKEESDKKNAFTDIIKNYQSVSSEQYGALMAALTEDEQKALQGVFKANADGSFTVDNTADLIAAIKNPAIKMADETREALLAMFTTIANNYTKRIQDAVSLATKGTTNYQDMQDFATQYKDTMHMNLSKDAFKYDDILNAWTLDSGVLHGYIQKQAESLKELGYLNDDNFQQYVDSQTKEQFASLIDLNAFITAENNDEGSLASNKLKSQLRNYYNSIDKATDPATYMESLNLKVRLGEMTESEAEQLAQQYADEAKEKNEQMVENTLETFRKGGAEAVEKAMEISSAAGKELSVEDQQKFYAPLAQKYVGMAEQLGNLVAGQFVGDDGDNGLRSILESVGIVDASTGLVQSVENLASAYKAIYEKLSDDANATTSQLNSVYAQFLTSSEQNEIDAISAMSEAMGMTYDSLGALLSNYDIKLEDAMADQQKYGIEQIGNGKIRIQDIQTFAQSIGLNASNSEEYLSAFKTYNDSLIELNRKTEKNIKEEVTSITGVKEGDWLNLSYFSEALQEIVTGTIKHFDYTGGNAHYNTDKTALDDLNDQLTLFGASIENGILKIGDNANLLGIANVIGAAAQTAGVELSADLAAVADAVKEVLKSYTDAIINGISGGLDNAGKVDLISKAKDLGISNLKFDETAEGFKLAQNSAIQLYQAISKIDALQGKIVFDELNSSLEEANENYQSVTSILNRISSLSAELNAIDSNISDSRRQEYEAELEVAKQIVAVRSTAKDDSFNFMSNEIPAAQNNPLNYYSNWADAIQKLNTAMKTKSTDHTGKVHKGLIDYQDWYNIATEMNNIAALGGEFEVAGVKLDGSLEAAAELIQKGANALTSTDTGEIKVALGDIGIDFKTGSGEMTEGINKGLAAVADSQIEMLDGLINMLELIVAMEQLGDITGEDTTIDLGDIFAVTNGGEATENIAEMNGFTEKFIESRKKLVEYLNSDDGQDAKNVFENTKVKIGNEMRSMYDMMNMDFSELFPSTLTPEQKESAVKSYQSILDGLYQAAISGNYDLDNIAGSLQEILNSQNINFDEGFTLDVGDITYTIQNGVVVKAADWSDEQTQKALASYKKNKKIKDDETAKANIIKAIQDYLNGQGTNSEDVDITTILKVRHNTLIKTDKNGKNYIVGSDGKYYYQGSNEYRTAIQKAILSDQQNVDLNDINIDKDTGAVTANINYGVTEKTKFKVTTDDDGNVTWEDDEGHQGKTEQELLENIYRDKKDLGDKEIDMKEFESWLYVTYGTHLKIKTEVLKDGNVITDPSNDPEVKAAIKELLKNKNYEITYTGAGHIEVKLGDGTVVQLNAEDVQYDPDTGTYNQSLLAEALGQLIGVDTTLGETISQSIVAAFAGEGSQAISSALGSAIATALTGSGIPLDNLTINPGSVTVDEENIKLTVPIQTATGEVVTLKVTAKNTEADGAITDAQITAMLENATVEVTINKEQATKDLGTIKEKVEEIPTSTVTTPTVTGETAFTSAIDKLIKKAKELAKTWKVTFAAEKTGNWPSKANGWIAKTGNVGQAMAGGSTLMGELGPELVVQNGRYFVAGQSGAEFVDLKSDAIVFNHLQTEQLLKNGMSSERGRAVTNERTAVAYAKGSLKGGPAMSSASAALAALKQLRSQWQSLASLSAQDLAGAGGGGGGGGNKNFLKDLEQWYNWLQKIATLEKDINYYEAERNRISSEYAPDGTAYFESQKKSLQSLQEQLETQAALNQSQEEYFEERRKYLNSNNNPFSALYEFDETGQLKYKDGMYEKLAYMSGTDEYGNANMTAEEQYNYIVNTLGISADYMKYNSSGEEIDADDYASKVQAFWDKIDADQSEMQSLYDNIRDGQEQLESLQQQQNEILKEMRDNQMAVETKVYNAIVEIRQRVIDELTDTKEAIQDSNDKFIQGLSDALNKEQTMYNNNESRKELDRLRSQRDILMRSGGSAAEISSLNDQISDQEQTVYFEKWQEEIDAIQEASDKQIEKLEAQIQLETEILDYQKKHGLLWGQVTDIMNQSPEKIANFIAQNTEEYWNKSPVASAEAMNQLTFSVEQWTGYRDEGGTLKADIEAIKKALGAEDGDDGSGDGSGGKWVNDGNGGYKYDEDGKGNYATNKWKKINGKWYKFDENSKMQTGWVQDGGKWYYLGSDGAMLTGDQTIDGTKYRFGDDGALLANLGGADGDQSGSGKYRYKVLVSYLYQGSQQSKEGIGDEKSSINEAKKSAYSKVEIPAGAANIQATYTKYRYGGLATNTGLAWLDGTKSKPEAVLNASQTQVLRDNILSNKPNSLVSLLKSYNDAYKGLSSNTYDSINTNNSNSTQIGKAEVNLNIDKLANDYDAKRAANTVMDEMLRIASKTGATNGVRR